MKRQIFLLAVFCAATWTNVAMAGFVSTGDTIVMSSKPGRTGIGGPFIMTNNDTSKGSFVTFCLEVAEHFYFGREYYVTVEDEALYGQNGGVVNGGDPLSDATGTLYQTFRRGGLGVVSGWTGSVADEGQLQLAIWSLEGETVSLGALASDLKTWAINNANANHNVRVANLWKSESTAYTLHGARQSQLTLVPEPASLAAWGGLALVFGAGFYLRRRRSK